MNQALKKASFEVSLFYNNSQILIVLKISLFSSSTAVVLVLCNDNSYISSIGDLRAVLDQINEYHVFTSINLTTDHKPDKPSEWDRIEQCRGYISALPFLGYTTRVW